MADIDPRRTIPRWAPKTFEQSVARQRHSKADVLIFRDTFTNYYEPEIGVAAWKLLEASGVSPGLAPNVCCGRPLISKGLLKQARDQARRNTELLQQSVASGHKLLFLSQAVFRP